MTREPDPWAGCRAEQEAKAKPVLCHHCGEESYNPEEVISGDLLCEECAEKFHKEFNRRGGAK